ncbi:oligosaccharide flippase family protein [Marivivens donghaensis]|uniref:Oligosaccharide flippase family protein n=1 Tax=Marivivens donghaensis TaxID=1699413 RepID=A0ABX0W555_9RHOB|nr:oligosaccharide flippase family protein [Marivivens donghaensis]NIY74008.1 oligosaccharide flippase family protein [Marivivens donghaensis]
MDRNAKSARDVASIIISSSLSITARIITLAVLARLLQPDDFGLVAFSIAVQTLFSLVAQLDIRDSLIQLKSINVKHIKLSFSILLVSSLFWYGILYLSSNEIAKTVNMNDLPKNLKLAGLLIILDAVLVPIEALLIRSGHIREIAKNNSHSYIFGFMVTGCVAASIYPHSLALVLAWLAMGIFRLGSGIVAIFRNFQSVRSSMIDIEQSSYESASDILRFAILGTGNRFLTTSAKQVDTLIVGSLLGSVPLGLYSRAYALAITPVNTLLVLVGRSVIFPRLSRLQQSPSDFDYFVSRALTMSAYLMLPLTAYLAVCAKDVIGLLFGPGWGATIFPFQCLLVGLSISFFQNTLSAVGRALARQSTLLRLNALCTSLIAACVYLGSLISQIDGASIGFLVASVLNSIISASVLSNITSMSSLDIIGSVRRPATLGLLTALIVYTCREILTLFHFNNLFTLIIIPFFLLALYSSAVLLLPRKILDTWERNVLIRTLLPAEKILIFKFLLDRLRSSDGNTSNSHF